MPMFYTQSFCEFWAIKNNKYMYFNNLHIKLLQESVLKTAFYRIFFIFPPQLIAKHEKRS
ncbi:MAG: hypothetical protein EAZ41_10730 [Sphingobacteriia bacterium]|nr:MAG: hypothetical protein EAZ41_10730 [Sphingobacteriia bacterium]